VYEAALPSVGHELAGVITMPTERRPEGAGGELVASDAELRDALARLRPDVALCNGWGFRISAATMAVPRHGIVNGHPSKLPRWRGPNPFGWTLRAGDPELGFTWHRMDDDFDTGAVLAQGSTPLRGDETVADLGALVAPLAAPLLERALARAEAGDPGDPQREDGVTYAGRFEDEFAEIDWTQPARSVFDQVRCWSLPTVSGIWGPLTTLAGERVRVLEATLDLDGDGVLVECADGPLRVVRTEPL
jgi:methionyl-tRNA formyltransferase